MDDYKILGASRSDTIDIITQKYKKLARKYHPDRNISNKIEAEEKFKSISAAYNNIINKKSNPFTSFSSKNFNDDLNFSSIFSKINDFKSYFKDVDYEDMLKNVLEKVNNFNDTMNSNLEKTEDLYINANIEFYDIYNNINKKITIERLRKCNICKIDYCDKCNGKKYINKTIVLEFNCKYKNIIFKKYSHHYVDKIPGDIHINILPKIHINYNIFNTYDLIYNYHITNNGIDELKELDISFKHLDNNYYSFKIINPILHYKYKIKDLGLLHNTDEYIRGDLYLILTKLSINTSIIKI